MKKTMKNGKVTRREFIGTTAKAAAAVTVAGAVSTMAVGCSAKPRPDTGEGPADLVITNGLVYDGSGSEPKKVDIAVRGDRIVTVGQQVTVAPGVKIIDAVGKTVTPGFIDVHTHCDLTFKRTGWKRHLARVISSWKGNHNYLYQGVTTVVTGNCGYGYTDTEKWYAIAESVGFGTNVAHLIPHGILREDLFGEEAQPKKLTAAQLDRMRSRVAEEMGKGAFGMSSGLEYAPGCLVENAELISLAKVVGRYNGLYTSHIRDESGKICDNGKHAVINAMEETIAVAREAGVPVEISHLKISAPIAGTPPAMLLETIEKARAEGLNVNADQYPYAAGSTVLTFLAPNEMKTASGIKAKYKTPEGRKQIEAAIKEVFAYAPPEKTLITMYDEKEEYEGKTLAEIGEIEGRSAALSFVDMACEDNPPMAVFFFQDMDVVKALMPRDFIITASDGWTNPKNMGKPHPRVYGTFPRKLRRFVMDDKLMALSLAIRSMTSLPAEKFGIAKRGRIAEGYFADIAVLDMDRIGDHATYTDPHRNSTGIDHLLVNGVLSIENGLATGDRSGYALRRNT
ncbi:MAG: D-aminoacylase [Desulfobacterales bacterium]|nr:D-aminoacylase [Desulfobacterales bacterium]